MKKYELRVQGSKTLTIYRQGSKRLYVADVSKDRLLFNTKLYDTNSLYADTGLSLRGMVSGMIKLKLKRGNLHAPQYPIAHRFATGRVLEWSPSGTLTRTLSRNGIEDLREEVRLHPDDDSAISNLATLLLYGVPA